MAKKHSLKALLAQQNVIKADEKSAEEMVEEADEDTSSGSTFVKKIIPKSLDALVAENEALRNQAILSLDPGVIEVTKYANRNEIFFKTEEFHELVEQIQSEGQLIAIGVRPSQNPEFEYQLVYGRRRLEACKELGINVKAVLLDADDKSLLIKQYLENKRADLSYFEESDNLILMKEDGFFKNAKELAAALGISEGKVSQLLSLKALPQWLKDDYLTLAVENPETGFVEIDIAPLRSVRTKLAKRFKEIDLQQTEDSKTLLEAHKDMFFILPDWVEKIDFILDITSSNWGELFKIWQKRVQDLREQLKPKEEKPINTDDEEKPKKQKTAYYIDSKCQIGDRKAGTIKASSDSGISVKIDKRFYSKALADELNEMVNSLLENRFGGKDDS